MLINVSKESGDIVEGWIRYIPIDKNISEWKVRISKKSKMDVYHICKDTMNKGWEVDSSGRFVRLACMQVEEMYDE